MGLERRLRRALEVAKDDFARALDCYDPTTGVNAYPERMVSFYYIQALANALQPARVLLEIPVAGARGHKRDNHIDALIFNDRETMIAEFKRAWTPRHWRDLADDLKRVQGRAGREIRKRFEDNHKRRSYIFLGADCWYSRVAKAWKTGSREEPWPVPPSLRATHRDYLRVYLDKGETHDGYYLTWALIPFDEKAA